MEYSDKYPVLSSILKSRKLLQDILSQLSAPHLEYRLENFLKETLKKKKISYFQDSFGNLWANAKDIKTAKKAKLILVAHLDHPGIVIEEFLEKKDSLQAKGQWLGGGPKNIEGAKVTLFTKTQSVPGTILKSTYAEDRPNKVILQIDKEPKSLAGDWGACFDIKTEIGREIRTRSADDLLSVAALVESLLQTTPSEEIVFLFSRSEEIHEQGVKALLKKKTLNPKGPKILVVDTTEGHTRMLGQGIIIRSGDQDIDYGDQEVQWLQNILCDIPYTVLRTQGRTDGYEFKKHKFLTASLALPILHQHNVSWNNKPVPEVAQLKDYDFLVQALKFIISSVLQDTPPQSI